MISKFKIISSVLLAALLAGAGVSLSAEDRGAENGSRTAGRGKVAFPRPDTHKGNWIEFHGASANLNVNEAGQTGKSCLTCHERNDCITCHNTRMPRDHTNTWRTLSHGFQAEGNRERCMTCHKQDYCVRCHNETAPRTHKGNWQERHCSWCHFGSGFTPADSCVVCHKTAPHTSAPHPVNPAADCWGCHSSL
jgi:hypothetical protein